MSQDSMKTAAFSHERPPIARNGNPDVFLSSKVFCSGGGFLSVKECF